MIEAFNGPVFLILFIVNLLGGAYYTYQALFTSEKFCDQYDNSFYDKYSKLCSQYFFLKHTLII